MNAPTSGSAYHATDGAAYEVFLGRWTRRGVFDDATQAFFDVLDGYTLADLIKPQRALSSLLLLDQHAARTQ